MSLAITLNLIAIVIVVGGWTAAVWAFYKKLGDPHAEAEGRRADAGSDSGFEHDLTQRRAA